MDSTHMIRVPGLTKFDQLEMTSDLASDLVRFEPQAMGAGKHGELLSTAVIVGSVLGIRALAAWLLKTRKNNKISKRIEIIGADGSTRIESIDIDLSSSTAPDSDVLKQLAKLLNLDLGELLNTHS
jgi:hypothetical protein